MTEKEITNLSRFMSLVLRHQPEKIGLELDAQGWVSVAEFMEKMQDYQQTPQAQANFEQDLNIDLDQGKETKSAGVGYGKIQPLFGLGGSGGKKSSTSSSLRPDSGESNPLSGILSQMQMG